MLNIVLGVPIVICILFLIWFFACVKSFETEAKARFGEKPIPYVGELEEKK